jgi:hypothetical protein
MMTLSVIGSAASVFAVGSVALRQQGRGAVLAFVIAARAPKPHLGRVHLFGRAVTFALIALSATTGRHHRRRPVAVCRQRSLDLRELPASPEAGENGPGSRWENLLVVVHTSSTVSARTRERVRQTRWQRRRRQAVRWPG